MVGALYTLSMIREPRKLYEKLPTFKELIRDKRFNQYLLHPKGGYVYIKAGKVNQYTVNMSIDLWNINYNVSQEAGKRFMRVWSEYIDRCAEEKRKGLGTLHCGAGGAFNMVWVPVEDADKWLKRLWLLCSDDSTIVPLDSHA